MKVKETYMNMNEEFDFSGMSDTDYTDYFADMDQDAEETAEFERIFTAAAWYCTTATELTYKPEPIRRDRLGGGLRVEKVDGVFNVSVAVEGHRTSVILDLDKIPADTYEYSVVMDPGRPDSDDYLCMYVIPRADGTLKGSPAYVEGGYVIAPVLPTVKPFYTYIWTSYYGKEDVPVSDFRPLRSFIGSPLECAYFGVARTSRGASPAAGVKDLWRTKVTDLTGSPDIVHGRVDLSHCPSLTSGKGAPRRVEKDLNLLNTRVRPWDDNLRCVPLFGDGVDRKVDGNIIVSAPYGPRDRRRRGRDAVYRCTTKKIVNLGRPGSGDGLAGLIADNCSCEEVLVDMISATASADLRDLKAVNKV